MYCDVKPKDLTPLSVCSYFCQLKRFILDVSRQDVVAELPSFSLNVELRLESLVVDLSGGPELDVGLQKSKVSNKGPSWSGGRTE